MTVAPDAAKLSSTLSIRSKHSAPRSITFEKRTAESVTVVGYFNELPDEERVQDELHYALTIYGFTEEIAMQVVSEQRSKKPTGWPNGRNIGNRRMSGSFVIAPPWSDVETRTRSLIRIEPNMAFGTGTHETTQFCLRAIEKYYEPGDSFLDVGTGTGILAIAAA